MENKVSKLINDQINKEMYSAYLYLEFANHFTEKGLNGFANWYNIQAKEEMDHALKFIAYLHDNDEKVTYESIAKPESKSKEDIDVLKAAYAHEKFITASINAIYAEASKVNDYRTTQFLDWFISEQAEEEKNAADLIQKMDLFGSDPKALYLLDHEFSTRSYKPSAQ